MLAEVCSAVVHIHKRFYGKGPTKARAHLCEDLLAVVLEGGFTRGEETLQQRGHESEVLHARIVMQRSVEDEFRGAIEAILGRAVRSFMSANDPARGLQVEIFVLHPDGVDEAERRDEDDLSVRARQARQRHREILEEHRALRAEQEQSRRAVQQERRWFDDPKDA
jgi:uncharacterized protein YbcI